MFEKNQFPVELVGAPPTSSEILDHFVEAVMSLDRGEFFYLPAEYKNSSIANAMTLAHRFLPGRRFTMRKTYLEASGRHVYLIHRVD